MDMKKKIGVFGGTFDPPHLYHWKTAWRAQEAMGFDELWFMPISTQPLKGKPYSESKDRIVMLELLIKENWNGTGVVKIDDREIKRGGISYTVDTLEELAREHKDVEWQWIVGADATETFGMWKDIKRIAELAKLIVMDRAGCTKKTGEVAYISVEFVGNEMSSTEIRAKIKNGESVAEAVGQGVLAYIKNSSFIDRLQNAEQEVHLFLE